jgi:outer membrane biosynthesis protein TonB
MSITARSPFETPEDATAKWVAIFILLSLLAHAIIIAAILLITVVMPVPKIIPPAEAPKLTVTLAPPPAAPQPKPIFIPTTPDANTRHQQQPVVSANDRELTSQSTVARKPTSIMPDTMGKEHAPDLNNTPNVQAPPKPVVSTTQPTPRTQPEKPTPPHPNPAQAQTPPQPPQPQAKPAPPPPKPSPPQVDPDTGLPLLPPIAAPTLAPPNSAAPQATPRPSVQQTAASVHGALGRSGDTSPAAMATALGKYKQQVYLAVGSHWYPKIDKSLQLIGVGMVHIQFTIASDGTVTTKVLGGDTATLQILQSISINSILESAPFPPFPPAMVKELIEEQGGDGSSYTDDFTFSVY